MDEKNDKQDERFNARFDAHQLRMYIAVSDLTALPPPKITALTASGQVVGILAAMLDTAYVRNVTPVNNSATTPTVPPATPTMPPATLAIPIPAHG
jgi:hypothetical protein